MKLYVLLNINHEGTNYRGVYTTLERARAECRRLNARLLDDVRTMFRAEPKEDLDGQLEHVRSWDLAEVYEFDVDKPYCWDQLQAAHIPDTDEQLGTPSAGGGG